MGLLIASVGGLVAVFALVGIVKSTATMDTLEQVKASPAKIYAGAAARFIVGLMLFLGASSTAAPGVVGLIGLLAMLGGALILVIGVEGAISLIDWFVSRSPTVQRLMFLAAAAVGVLLVGAGVSA